MAGKWENTAGPVKVQVRDWTMEVYPDRVIVSRDGNEVKTVDVKDFGQPVLKQCSGCGGRYPEEDLTRSDRYYVLLCGPCLSEKMTRAK